MKKNYQIELCKECWHINYSRSAVECYYFSKHIPKPYTKETAKETTINDKKNNCRLFEKRKSNRILKGIKEYQIELCKKCKYMDWDRTKKCLFLLEHGGLTPETARQPTIDYEKNTCQIFKSTKSMEGGSLGSGINPRSTVSGKEWSDREARRSWKGGCYYGQS